MSAREEWLNHPLTRQLRRDIETAGASLEASLGSACRSGTLEKIRVVRAALDLLDNVHGMLLAKKDEAEDGED